MKESDAKLLNGIALAYIGDAVLELFVRQHLLEQGVTRPNQLHRRATHYVSAKAQRVIYEALCKEEMLSEEEINMFKRGRNAHSKTKAKNTDTTTYAISTGFEALLGYLYLGEKKERLEELLRYSVETIGEIQKYEPK